jgi:hypothetical protein
MMFLVNDNILSLHKRGGEYFNSRPHDFAFYCKDSDACTLLFHITLNSEIKCNYILSQITAKEYKKPLYINDVTLV